MTEQWPPALIAAADQAAAAYNDMVVRFPTTQGSFNATFDADALRRVAATLPRMVDLVGGPLDGLQWRLAPGMPAPLLLLVEVGEIQHVYSRVVCDWWTCYEWVQDLERP